MSSNEKKVVGKQFIQKLLANCKNEASFNKILEDYLKGSPDNRLAVAMSLLEIGADLTESAFNRNFALSQLATFVGSSSMQNNVDVQKQLISILNGWIFDVPEQHCSTPPFGALLALLNVNKKIGLEKCDSVIKYYGESESAFRIRKLRDCFEQLI
jgi:hypothetical protein